MLPAGLAAVGEHELQLVQVGQVVVTHSKVEFGHEMLLETLIVHHRCL